MSNSSNPEDYRLTLVLENQSHPESEPEEEWLVHSGALQGLLTNASRQPPVEDWEHLLDEL